MEIAARSGAEPDTVAELEYTRGEIYWALARPETAIEAWELALRANPRHEKAAHRLAAAREDASQAQIR